MNELFNTGNEHYLKGEFAQARACYEAVLQQAPEHVIVLHNHGLACTQLGDYLAALNSFDKAVNQRYVESFISRGSVHRTLGNYSQAMYDFANAFLLDPRHPSAYSNYGNSLREFGMPDIAIPFLKLAQQLDSEPPMYRLNESVAHLSKGDLLAGWEKYDARWFYESDKSLKPNLPGPEYDGTQDINGLNVLVYGEQGFGDCIQFIRYVSMLGNLGAKVIIYVRPQLQKLFEYNYPKATVITDSAAMPKYHYHCPIMSLPACFKTTIDTIPSPTPYLSVDRNTLTKFDKIINQNKKLRVGIVWSSNNIAWTTRFRSIELEKLLQIQNDDLHLINLEFDYAKYKDVLEENDVSIYNEHLTDFYSHAALVKNCDVVVTVDTAIAHLAGALGVPTFVMLSDYAVDWRWFLNRDDSPFYSCVKLFRQKNNSWETVIESIKIELKSLVDNK